MNTTETDNKENPYDVIITDSASDNEPYNSNWDVTDSISDFFQSSTTFNYDISGWDVTMPQDKQDTPDWEVIMPQVKQDTTDWDVTVPFEDSVSESSTEIL